MARVVLTRRWRLAEPPG